MNQELADAFLDTLVRVGKLTSCDRVLLIGTTGLALERLKAIKKKLIFASHLPHAVQELSEGGVESVLLPGFTAGRTDRLKAAIVGAVSAGYLKRGENVLCAVTAADGVTVDTLMHITAGDVEEEHSSLVTTSLECGIPAQLLEVALDLALRVGRDGYEGRPLGTLLVLGDSTRVMERSHPLTLNPFQGYSEVERNLFDAHVREAVRTFAMLDGAFVVRDDGVVLAGGRHIHVGDEVPTLPLGMGARHIAAAAISAESKAVAIAVSQSSGVVRLFHGGKIALEIQPSGRRAELSEKEVSANAYRSPLARGAALPKTRPPKAKPRARSTKS